MGRFAQSWGVRSRVRTASTAATQSASATFAHAHTRCPKPRLRGTRTSAGHGASRRLDNETTGFLKVAWGVRCEIVGQVPRLRGARRTHMTAHARMRAHTHKYTRTRADVNARDDSIQGGGAHLKFAYPVRWRRRMEEEVVGFIQNLTRARRDSRRRSRKGSLFRIVHAVYTREARCLTRIE